MNRLCPVCNSNNKKFLYKQNFNNTSISPMDSYEVCYCNICGFIFADQIPSQKDLDFYYQNLSKYENNYSNSNLKPEYDLYYNEVFKFIYPYVVSLNHPILDIGCSTGELLNIFKQQGFTDITGIDPSPYCKEKVKKLYDIKIETGCLNSFHLQNTKKFNIIILSEVLEHVIDLDEFFGCLNNLLNDDGLLLITTPDLKRFSPYISIPFQQFSTEHINFFTETSMTNLLKKYKFNVVQSDFKKHIYTKITDPDLFIIAKKDFYKKDEQGISCIKSYIEQSEILDASNKNFYKELIKKYDSIIIWGTGTQTLRILNDIDINKIEYFVDSNNRYHNKYIKGKIIKSPKEIKEDYPILISTYAYEDDIINIIKNELKLKNEILKINNTNKGNDTYWVF